MKSIMKVLYAFVLSCLVSFAAIADTAKPVHIVRFNDYETGSEEDWLQGKGFEFTRDMRKRNLIDLGVNDASLVIEAKRRALGVMLNETVNVAEFSYLEVDWGISLFPEGSSYEQGVRTEAIMVLIFMGDERMPSGSVFIPDSPFFIGLYLCDSDDRVNHPYQGVYFKKNGRYVCVDRPAAGETVTSRFDLFKAYRSYFDKEQDDDPGISGLAIALDTRKAGNGGKSSAFIKEIRIYQ